MTQVTSMRRRHRFNGRMTRIILLISFLFLFGRFVYSSIGAWYHHQDKKAEAQQSSLSVDTTNR
ncbi:YfgG family protein [Dryocola sp. BD626]|uniref:YfgG family protein n=1 Tax=Dryocola sp. BD626 TaxID=3133273 RepID=UPI003F504ABE